jgi:predicted nucleic acid-binding protein
VAAYLVDTGLLLRHLRGQRNAVRLLAGLGKMGRLSVSAITRLEVHAGMRPDERYATNKLLSRFVTCDVDREVADRAGELIRKRSESRDRRVPLGVPDAIIAATALTHGLTLVTLNRADFEDIPGISLASLPEEPAP